MTTHKYERTQSPSWPLSFVPALWNSPTSAQMVSSFFLRPPTPSLPPSLSLSRPRYLEKQRFHCSAPGGSSKLLKLSPIEDSKDGECVNVNGRERQQKQHSGISTTQAAWIDGWLKKWGKRRRREKANIQCMHTAKLSGSADNRIPPPDLWLQPYDLMSYDYTLVSLEGTPLSVSLAFFARTFFFP